MNSQVMSRSEHGAAAEGVLQMEPRINGLPQYLPAFMFNTAPLSGVDEDLLAHAAKDTLR